MVESNPILHVGFPKTASTWFQEMFYPELHGIRYIQREIVQDHFITPGAFEFNLNKTKAFFSSPTNKQTTIICEELLLGRLRPGGVQGHLTVSIAQRLKQVFPEAKIIIMLRNQLDALASSYSEYIKSGGNFSASKFLKSERLYLGQYHKLALLQPEYFQYHNVLDLYASLFGQDKLKVYLYEDFLDAPLPFLTKLCQDHGLEMPLDPKLSVRRNERLRSLTLLKYRLINSFYRFGPLNKYYIMHIPLAQKLARYFLPRLDKYFFLGKRKEPSRLFTKDDLDLLNGIYRNSNKVLIEKYGLKDICKYNYPL